MRIAVIGAGIVGVTSAHELTCDGHEVTMFERHAGVASETSFANAGVISPGYVTPWAAPGMPLKVLRHLFGRHAPVRLAGANVLGQLPWMWRWWRACRPAVYRDNRAQMYGLARYSRQRLHELTESLGLEYEQARGVLVLLRSRQDLAQAQSALRMLQELQVDHELLDAAQCHRLEPGLNPDMPLCAGISLPQDGVGNCRHFAHLLKTEAQRRGARFLFRHEVLSLDAGPRPTVRSRDLDAAGGAVQASGFDVVLLCTGHHANRLLAPLHLPLPIAPVYGYSITAPLSLRDHATVAAPRAAVMDEKYKVAITRLGQRIRVAGSAELGGAPAHHNPAALATLYTVLDDWFPGAARLSQATPWKGARPMLPDGPPLLGPTRSPGLWLNLGHGSSGWALACGSARIIADLIGARSPPSTSAACNRSGGGLNPDEETTLSMSSTANPRRILPGEDSALRTRAVSRDIEAAALSRHAPHALMQRAGTAVARPALAIAPHARRIWVACGPGNNGGDGLVAARHLHRAGLSVQATLVGDARRLPADASRALADAVGDGVPISDAMPATPADLVIDALLGLGASRAPQGALADAIAAVQARQAPVLAVDLPSGLHADTGQPLGASAVAASHTLALLTLKPGLFTGSGRDHAGQVWLDTLGVPVDEAGATATLSGADSMSALAPRTHASHKGNHGDLVVIAGAAGMTGAALLAARAGLAGGAGRVFVSLLDPAMPPGDTLHPELMFRPQWWRGDPATLPRSTAVCGRGGRTPAHEALPPLLSRCVCCWMPTRSTPLPPTRDCAACCAPAAHGQPPC